MPPIEVKDTTAPPTQQQQDAPPTIPAATKPTMTLQVRRTRCFDLIVTIATTG